MSLAPEGGTTRGTKAMAAHHNRSKRQTDLVQHARGKQIVVQPRTALTQQPLEARSGQLIHDVGQIQRRAFSLEHGPRRSGKIICYLPAVVIMTAPPTPSAGVAMIGSRSALAETITNIG